VPAGATELAVALCYTPVGTAGANDYVTFSGIQLTRNNALATVAGTAGAALSVNDRAPRDLRAASQALETRAAAALFLPTAAASPRPSPPASPPGRPAC
jgi:hypothetical protein